MFEERVFNDQRVATPNALESQVKTKQIDIKMSNVIDCFVYGLTNSEDNFICCELFKSRNM